VEPPLIPGWDAAGIVDDADPATGYVSGDEVLAIKLPVIEGGGTYAEKIVVAPESVTRLPRDHDFAAGSTVLMNGLTALQALDKLDSPAGGVTAVTGGAGVLGGYVLEPAKKRGFRDVLTNNAADTAGGNLVTGEMEAVRRVMEWNCYGTMDVIRAFATVLARNGGGAIVNVLSQSRGSPWTATPLTVQPSQPSGGSPTVCASNWPARERKSSVSCPDSSPRRPCTTSPARPGSNSPKARSPNRPALVELALDGLGRRNRNRRRARATGQGHARRGRRKSSPSEGWIPAIERRSARAADPVEGRSCYARRQTQDADNAHPRSPTTTGALQRACAIVCANNEVALIRSFWR